MKLKHNKKRNTAILYEILIRELTRASINKNNEKKAALLTIVKESFNKNTNLGKELELYRVLGEGEKLHPATAERLIYEARKVHLQIDKKVLFQEQNALINRMNRVCSKSVFSNFVPSYKSLATIFQIFSEETPIKKRVLLEEKLIGEMITEPKKIKEGQLKPVDNLVYKSFVNKFNDQYSESLLVEQKELLIKYISSFTDNGLQLKVYLNEEVTRLKNIITESLDSENIKEDPSMVKKTNEVLELIENLHGENVDSIMVKKILRIQNLAREINS